MKTRDSCVKPAAAAAHLRLEVDTGQGLQHPSPSNAKHSGWNLLDKSGSSDTLSPAWQIFFPITVRRHECSLVCQPRNIATPLSPRPPSIIPRRSPPRPSTPHHLTSSCDDPALSIRIHVLTRRKVMTDSPPV